MNLIDYAQIGPWILEEISTSFGRKQFCGIDGCHQKSGSQFKIFSQSHGCTRYACSYCTSYLTGYDITKLSVVETYISSIKNQFKDLKNFVGMNAIYNHPNKDIVGQLNTTIGEHRILITMFKDGKYNMMIDGKPVKADYYKSFKSKKLVAQRVIDIINNRNKDKLFYYITNC